MRRPGRILLACSAVAALAVLLTAALHTTTLAFTVGVAPAAPAAELEPGDVACQGLIEVPEQAAFDRVGFQVGTYGQPGPPLAVLVRDAAGRAVATGRLDAGYPDVAQALRHSVRVGRVPAGSQIDVCVANRGQRRVALYGNGAAASRTTSATLNGEPLPADLDFTFERDPRSVAELAPAIAQRASLFSADFAGAWTSALLGGLVVLLPVGLLAFALRRSARADAGKE